LPVHAGHRRLAPRAIRAGEQPGRSPTRRSTPRFAVMITNVSLATVWVTDQDEAKAFYIDQLGFQEHTDVTMGDGYRWLTVSHPDHPELELTLMKRRPPQGGWFSTRPPPTGPTASRPSCGTTRATGWSWSSASRTRARTSPTDRRCRRAGHLIFRTAIPNVHLGLTATPPTPPRVPLQRSVPVLPLHQHPPELARWLPGGGCSHHHRAPPLPPGAPDARSAAIGPRFPRRSRGGQHPGHAPYPPH